MEDDTDEVSQGLTGRETVSEQELAGLWLWCGDEAETSMRL